MSLRKVYPAYYKDYAAKGFYNALKILIQYLGEG